MSNDIISFDKKEALRYFRAQPGDVQAEAAIDSAYEKLRKELQPRYTVKKFGCRAFTEKGLLQVHPELAETMTACNEADDVLSCVVLDNGTVFRSRSLAR